MGTEKYIKAIEELNKEYITFINSKIYVKANRKSKLKKIIKNFDFKLLFESCRKSIYNRLHKPIKKTTKAIETKRKDGKIVVYTCITDKYDKLLSPLITTDNTDYIVFSNDESIVKNTNYWKYRPISKEIIKKCNNNPTLINRYIKMHPKKLFKDYDFALYIDGNVKIISDIKDCFNFINDKTGLAMHEHSKRQDVYEEASACIHLKKGNIKNIKNLIRLYKKEQFPHNFGLFEATIIAVDLNNKNSKIILSKWYDEFIKTETFRDQLTFTYVLWKNRFKYEDIGILGNNIHYNSKFRICNHTIKPNWLKYKIRIIKKIIKNFGGKNKCNMCHFQIKKWKSGGHKHQIFIDNKIVGAGYRNTFQCPVCGAKDKDRLVYYYIKNYTDILNGSKTILHFAPEPRIKKKIKRNKKAKYYNCDINPNHADMVIDITNINFPDNTFDYIICNHVLEHIIDEKKAIKELKRVIKPKGKIILTIPICISNDKTIEDNSIVDPKDRLSMFCQEDHVRLYGNDFKSRIEKYELKVDEYKINNKKIESKYGLLKEGVIYIISK